MSPLQNLVAEQHHNRRMLLLRVSRLMSVVALRPSYHAVAWVSISSLEGLMHLPEYIFRVALPWARLLDVQMNKDLKKLHRHWVMQAQCLHEARGPCSLDQATFIVVHCDFCVTHIKYVMQTL